MHGLGRVSRLLRATWLGRCRMIEHGGSQTSQKEPTRGGIRHIEATADEEIKTRNLPWEKSAHRCTTVPPKVLKAR